MVNEQIDIHTLASESSRAPGSTRRDTRLFLFDVIFSVVFVCVRSTVNSSSPSRNSVCLLTEPRSSSNMSSSLLDDENKYNSLCSLIERGQASKTDEVNQVAVY